MYIILKKYKDGKHVIVLNGEDEVLEFTENEKDKAEKIAAILHNNDPKHDYIIKTIGSD
jgi:hypothetical protein